jgi:thiamine biosynthesis lipoprotein
MTKAPRHPAYLPTRRRAIAILAAASAAPLIGAKAKPPAIEEWNGHALGAQSHIRMSGIGQADMKAALSGLLGEIDRLEASLSLFRPDSEISRLNQDGYLDHPSLEMRTVLLEAQRLHHLTGGAFDVSVQPLWLAHSQTLATDGGSNPANLARIDKARALVDSNAIEVLSHRITLKREGMGITLNGIAQGYISDLVAAQLRHRGFTRTLVQLGETVAMKAPLGRPDWQVGLVGAHSSGPIYKIGLENAAVATSVPSALQLNTREGVGHIVPPKSSNVGLVDEENKIASVSVVAPNATLADGLSTALSILPIESHAMVIAQSGAHYAVVEKKSGEVFEVTPRGTRLKRGNI